MQYAACWQPQPVPGPGPGPGPVPGGGVKINSCQLSLFPTICRVDPAHTLLAESLNHCQ